MDFNKKLLDQLSDLSRNIKSLGSEVKENKNSVSVEGTEIQKESPKENTKKESKEEDNKKFLKSLGEIFKKGIGEITKSSEESSGLLKGVIGSVVGKEKETTESKEKVLNKLLSKIPKFEKGGVMDETGLALVGEKGPEVVKLEKGSEVIPNDKSKDLSSSIKTIDQSLTEKKGPTQDQIEKYKNSLIRDYPELYGENPELVDASAEMWRNLNQYNTSDQIDDILSGPETQSFTKENLEKLSEENKNIEVLGAKKEYTADEKLLEKKEKGEKEKSKLFEKAKNLAKEKEISDKGKNLLLSRGKDILIGKSAEGEKEGLSSISEGKNELISKGIGSATSLLSDKETREKGIEKIKNLKKKKEVEPEKSSISVESPELKKTPTKTEDKKEEPAKVEEKKVETAKVETKESSNVSETQTTKESKSTSPTAQSPAQSSSEGIKSEDFASMISLLSKIASLLEGPLSIETMESPFRPDSRRF